MTKANCSVDGCASDALARGWCSRHWQRWKRNGDPLLGRDRQNISDAERFWGRVEKTSGCWKWTGTLNDNGYGVISIDGRHVRAHRYAWNLLRGDIGEGMQLDHRCRNRACVNPDHLREVTNKQNQEHTYARSNNTSGYRGVTFNKLKGKWSVLVKHDGANHFGGYFTDVHEAGRVARDLRNELFTHNDMDRIAS